MDQTDFVLAAFVVTWQNELLIHIYRHVYRLIQNPQMEIKNWSKKHTSFIF